RPGAHPPTVGAEPFYPTRAALGSTAPAKPSATPVARGADATSAESRTPQPSTSSAPRRALARTLRSDLPGCVGGSTPPGSPTFDLCPSPSGRCRLRVHETKENYHVVSRDAQRHRHHPGAVLLVQPTHRGAPRGHPGGCGEVLHPGRRHDSQQSREVSRHRGALAALPR